MLTTLVFSFTAAAALVSAQSASSTIDVAPAATTVPADSTQAELNLLEPEVVQVTDAVITDLLNNNETAQYADLFAFADTNVTTESARRRHIARRAASCKTAPGDLLWPSKLVWSLFDVLLGGALNEIIPVGSVCYPKSQYNNYNAAKCQSVSTNFSTEALQYAHLSSSQSRV